MISKNAFVVLVEKPTKKKLKKSKNILSLSVETSIYVHIQNAVSALDIWQTLQRLYEDKGLSRKIGLLRSLISIRLEESANMQEYVDNIVNIVHLTNFRVLVLQ